MVKRHTRTRKQSGGTPALSTFKSDLDMFASEIKELWHKAGGSRKTRRHPRKGQKSRTHKGRRDFTTKKGNKKFNRKGHRQSRAQGSKKHRRPYSKRGGGQWSPLSPAPAQCE
jgi:hypothetical protein